MSEITLKSLATDSDFSAEDGTIFDIANNYYWTLTPPVQRVEPVPYIKLREFEQDLSTLHAQLYYWFLQGPTALTEVDNPYQDLYAAQPTGVEFILPYFEAYDHQMNQAWEPTKGLMESKIAANILNLATIAAKALGLAPGTYVNQPRVWSGSAAAGYMVNFLLFNTVSEEETEKNIKFKRRLEMSTLHDQKTALLASPPAIFEVLIPGMRWSPAAVISQLTVENVGQMNLNKVDGKVVICPDAWRFTLNITELITESRQLLKDVDDQKISAFVTTTNADGSTAAVGNIKGKLAATGAALGKGTAAAKAAVK